MQRIRGSKFQTTSTKIQSSSKQQAPKSQTNLKSQISNLKSQISNLKSQISNLKFQNNKQKQEKARPGLTSVILLPFVVWDFLFFVFCLFGIWDLSFGI